MMKIFDDENWSSEKKDKYSTGMKREWGNGSLHSRISLMGKKCTREHGSDDYWKEAEVLKEALTCLCGRKIQPQ